MKLNRENYELLMFDLLEGNLSESDELILMKQIEEDDFFFKEWKLFKATILVDDEVVYTNKKSLLKKEEKAIIIPMPRVWMSVAASVCLVAAVYVFWPSAKVVEPVAVDVPTKLPSDVNELQDNSEKEQSTLPIDQIYENEMIAELETAPSKKIKAVTELPQGIDLEKNDSSVPKTLLAGQKKDNQILIDEARKNIDNKMLDLHQADLQKQQSIVKEEILPTNEDTIVNPIDKSIEPKEIIADNTTPNEKDDKKTSIGEFVTKNPPSRIKEKAKEIIALVSNPKVRLKPNFKSKRPSLGIKVETEGYYAVASLQPFKNRNN